MGRLEYPLMMTSDKKPCWWNFVFWKTPFLQCEVTQRLISVLKQHPYEIGLSKRVLDSTTIDKQLYAAVSLLPHDAAASPSCAKKNGWIHSNMTPQNDRCSDMRFSRKNALPKIRIIHWSKWAPSVPKKTPKKQRINTCAFWSAKLGHNLCAGRQEKPRSKPSGLQTQLSRDISPRVWHRLAENATVHDVLICFDPLNYQTYTWSVY